MNNPRVEASRIARSGFERGGSTRLMAQWTTLVFCLICCPATALAQALSPQTELQQVANPDELSSHFGNALSLEGDRVLIGSTNSFDSAFTFLGAAFVYEIDAAGVWVQAAKLAPSGADRKEIFGYSVALSGNRALVGAPGPNDNQGAAYVFERDTAGTWVEVAKLMAADGALFDNFGGSVALSGDRALVGADGSDQNGIIQAGAAYVFERRASGEWVEVAKLTAPDAEAFDFFGGSVSLSDNRALVGMTGDSDAGFSSGAAYLFEPDELGDWVGVVKLTARDAAQRDFFGESVVLLGDRALVGAPGDDKPRVPGEPRIVRDTGSVYVFEPKATGAWRQVGKLTASDAVEGDRFGGAVALSENRALIGAGYKDVASDNSGAAYVYERDESGEWEEIALLAASDGAADDRLGSEAATEGSVALSGDVAFVGAGLAGDRGGNGGSAYVFGLDANTTAPLLMVDVVDNAKNGFRFEGIDSHREVLERTFKFGGSDLLLTVTGYDIDVANEVRVLVNGTRIGFLARTPNNGRRTFELVISKSLLNTTLNTIRFEQKTPGWRWGVENLLLSESNVLPSLALDSVDTGRYGFRYSGINSHRTALERQFESTDTDLTLTVTGFDIDKANEVRVLVNDTQIGFLRKTPNNGIRTTRLSIDNSVMNSSTGNTLRFEQTTPGWRWGVTNLVLSAGQ